MIISLKLHESQIHPFLIVINFNNVYRALSHCNYVIISHCPVIRVAVHLYQQHLVWFMMRKFPNHTISLMGMYCSVQSRISSVCVSGRLILVSRLNGIFMQLSLWKYRVMMQHVLAYKDHSLFSLVNISCV